MASSTTTGAMERHAPVVIVAVPIATAAIFLRVEALLL
jgi:hypothetical protein